MSNAVLSPKQLRFCQLLSEGESIVSAYKLAGYAPNSVNPYQGASKLARAPAIVEQVGILQARLSRSSGITRAELVNKQLQLAELARESGQYGISSACLTQVGRLLGMYVEQVDIAVGSLSGDGRLSEFSTSDLRALLKAAPVSQVLQSAE